MLVPRTSRRTARARYTRFILGRATSWTLASSDVRILYRPNLHPGKPGPVLLTAPPFRTSVLHPRGTARKTVVSMERAMNRAYPDASVRVTKKARIDSALSNLRMEWYFYEPMSWRDWSGTVNPSLCFRNCQSPPPNSSVLELFEFPVSPNSYSWLRVEEGR